MPRSEVLIDPDVTARRWPFPVRGSVLVVRPDPETDSGGDESTENAERSPSEFEEIRRVLDAFFDPRDHDYVGPVTPADLETKYGIAVEEQEKIQNLLDRLGGCYQLAVWDSNPDAARLRAEGKCIPKPAGMFMKTLDRLDWIPGAERQHLGKLGIYLPQLPMWLRSLVTPEQWSALEKRAELRRGEYVMWLNSPPPVPADVVIGPDNVLYMCHDDGEWLPVGSDIDGAEWKVLDGLDHELNPVSYDVAMLILNEMGLFQHGATAGWLAWTPPEAAIKRQVLSKQTRMTVFRPGEPPRRERSPRPEEARSLGDLPTLTDTGLTSRAYLWIARTRPTDTSNKPTGRNPDA
ncbi:hypothetical protein AB0H00_14320 [Nocardia sp. NPDC023852]|uniref:hypothetical protein n=1 Tax=Nocardia sp. NPDC023852 TaxID=3154697 RepID=UPI0033ECDA57